MSVSPTPLLGADLRAILAAGAIAGAVAVIASACGSSSVTATSPSPTKCQVAVATSMTSPDPGGAAGTVSVTTEPECTWGGASTFPRRAVPNNLGRVHARKSLAATTPAKP